MGEPKKLDLEQIASEQQVGDLVNHLEGADAASNQLWTVDFAASGGGKNGGTISTFTSALLW